jgi:hypothetical protein
MKKKVMIPALAALALGGQAMAADFNYNYVDAAIVIGDAGANDGKGLSIAGSTDMKGLYENAIGYGGATFVDFDGGSLLNLEAGLGIHWPLSNVFDFTGGGALEFNKYGNGGGSDLGFGLQAGVRAKPFSPAWELDGGIKYVDISQYDDTFIVLGARYNFRSGMSAGVQLQSGDIDYWLFSVRWEH